jgi:hypothetical protein
VCKPPQYLPRGDSFPEEGLAIAATIPAGDGIDIVGTATFIVDPDPQWVSCK